MLVLHAKDVSELVQRDAQIQRRRRLRDATLLVRERDDLCHHLLLGGGRGLGRWDDAELRRARVRASVDLRLERRLDGS